MRMNRSSHEVVLGASLVLENDPSGNGKLDCNDASSFGKEGVGGYRAQHAMKVESGCSSIGGVLHGLSLLLDPG